MGVRQTAVIGKPWMSWSNRMGLLHFILRYNSCYIFGESSLALWCMTERYWHDHGTAWTWALDLVSGTRRLRITVMIPQWEILLQGPEWFSIALLGAIKSTVKRASTYKTALKDLRPSNISKCENGPPHRGTSLRHMNLLNIEKTPIQNLCCTISTKRLVLTPRKPHLLPHYACPRSHQRCNQTISSTGQFGCNTYTTFSES